MISAEPKVVRFGNFELDQRTRELRKHGLRIKLQHQPLQVLSILLERRGEVVSREELQRNLWPNGVFVDFDHGLNTAIRKLRDALGDTAATPRYICTVDRHGYRFNVPVSEPSSNDELAVVPLAGSPVAITKPAIPMAPDDVPLGAMRGWWWLITAIVLLSTAVGSSWIWIQHRGTSNLDGKKMMLAILPFENLTGDPSQEYLSDGLTEEMITQVGRLDPHHLGVIGRTSVMHYKKTQQPLQRIAHELAVQYILEGSVRRDSTHVRISAHLIQVKDQTDLWSRQYDRELSSLLTLQGEIAQEVTDEIELTLTHHPIRPSRAPDPILATGEFDAYDLYLQGRYFWNKRSPEGFRQGVAYFQQAIQRNPADARAYAGLADSYAMMSGYYLVPPGEAMPKARQAALKALQIDDSLAEAHTSLAIISENYDWDWQTAEKQYLRSIELDPNYATAHQWYAEFLAFQGRFDEALIESERARKLDPLSLIIASDNAVIFYFSRRYDRAIERFQAVLDMDPSFTRAHLIVGAYAQKGQFKNAIAQIEAWRHIEKGPWTWAWEAYVYGRAGDTAKAQRALDRLQQADPASHVELASSVALAYIGLNDRDRAFTWLERACRDRSNAATTFKVDPIFDPLRSDPRFTRLLQQVGLTR